jgi:Tol biopolymer transport system component
MNKLILVILLEVISLFLIACESTPTITSTTTSSEPVKTERIVFQSDRDGDDEIYVMNSDGSNVVKLTNNTVRDTTPAWSPDGKKIVFASDRDSNLEIYVMNADGSNVVKLTNNKNVNLSPSWSPDGKKIAYRSGASVRDTGIYVMNTDGSTQIKLADAQAFISNQAWSPDGSEIIYSTEIDGQGEVYIMNSVDGSNKRRLIEPAYSRNNKMNDDSPAWFPMGDKMVFSSFRHGFIEESPGKYSVRPEIYLMRADGSELIRLTNTPYDTDSYPSWSPDGEKIVFISNIDGDNEIYIMNADGSDMIKLTDNTADDGCPCWIIVE